ncbi:MAG: FbpB family small basic protein [Bacillus sp. (in: firmicutes)]
MKRKRKVSFAELVLENKAELLKDLKAIESIEERLEKRHSLQFPKAE